MDAAESDAAGMDEAAREWAVKLERLRAVLAERGAASLQLSSKEALSWLLDGARVTVPYDGAPIASAVVTRDAVVVWVFRNEIDRLVEEEIGAVGDIEFRPVDWWMPLPSGLGGRGRHLAEAGIVDELRACRAELSPREIARFRALGHDMAAAVTRVASTLAPETTERAVEGRLLEAIAGDGAEPVVVLVSGQSRLAHRHPRPTSAPLGSRAMLVVGARRRGLTVSLTRWVGDEAGAEEPFLRLLDVEASAFEATQPGRELAEVFADIVTAYSRAGFADDEWRRHHQGGPTGYAGRDPKASMTAPGRVARNQAFAWNPSAPRQKVEDTVIVGAEGIEVLTADPRWPSLTVGGLPRPAPLPYQ